MNRFSTAVVSQATSPRADCPKDEDVEWHLVAAGLWPELQAKQLIMHAALCDHCGPRLRAATSVNDAPTSEEEKQLAALKAPWWPAPVTRAVLPLPPHFPFLKGLAPALALILIVAAFMNWSPRAPAPLSGTKFAEFAVSIHRQHAQGDLALEYRSDSQQRLNEWFSARLPFSLALPASPPAPGEDLPYRLEGARLVQVGGKPAVFISYLMGTDRASLTVTPDSVAVASGGVEVDFQKVSFHYRWIEGHKVVTWSMHGRTYALVSQEADGMQRSCMICHSAMRDRDLGQTPTPLRVQPVLQ
ncbi:MAG TPA: hypothetical protein VK473_03585 [Terriglobales bacterium]|nr:hypothetical protein [Terriglobales bacterium]